MAKPVDALASAIPVMPVADPLAPMITRPAATAGSAPNITHATSRIVLAVR